MSNYVYTDNNNAIAISKSIQGQVGPKGYTGASGGAGVVGLVGQRGEQGPDNLKKTDIAFSGDKESGYFPVLQGRLTLIGHFIFNDAANITSVKAIVGGHTSGLAARASIFVMNHTTESSNRVIIADKKFEVNGFGRPRDFEIIDLNISGGFPSNEDVLGVWAFIGGSKTIINDLGAQMVENLSQRTAIIQKEVDEREQSMDRRFFYEKLKREGMGTLSIIPEVQRQLEEEIQAADQKIAKETLSLNIAERKRVNVEGGRVKENRPPPGGPRRKNLMQVAYLSIC